MVSTKVLIRMRWPNAQNHLEQEAEEVPLADLEDRQSHEVGWRGSHQGGPPLRDRMSGAWSQASLTCPPHKRRGSSFSATARFTTLGHVSTSSVGARHGPGVFAHRRGQLFVRMILRTPNLSVR